MGKWEVTALKSGPQLITKVVPASGVQDAINVSGFQEYEIVKAELVSIREDPESSIL